VDDQQCLEKIRQGGAARTAGVSALYLTYARRFLAYFIKHRVPAGNAEELVQDVFVSVVRHCDSFRGDTRIDAWMWAIVRNALIDHFRRQRPEDALDDDELLELADTTADASGAADEELDDCVRRAYARFAEVHRDRAEVLSRVTFDDWSIEDVAAMLKRTPGATREYLSQCRKKLKAFLEPCREFLAG
jgi:RNA polymerase sigma-70 factor (ECF subfamily)